MRLSLASAAFFVCLQGASELLAQADFSIAVSPSQQTVWQAQSTSYLVTVGAINGFTGTVSLGVSGLPSQADCKL